MRRKILRTISLGPAAAALTVLAAEVVAQGTNAPLGAPEKPGAVAAVTDATSRGLDQREGQRLLNNESFAGGTTAWRLLATPVSRLFPGDVPIKPGAQSPVGNSPEAIDRGMRYFVSMNCVGCHAPNGGGGMGPALSNSAFVYGGDPANIYLSIYQGRPRGMPSWGAMLPDNIIWDLVAYVQNISREPRESWGKTISAKTLMIEQVPAEYFDAANPWSQTEAFSHGKKPNTAR